MTDASKNLPVETDPRFPSGAWTGFWIQAGLGKQSTSVTFRFADGKIQGAGSDMIGKFVFAGDYELKSGRCVMTKQYLGAHRVEYEGVCEGRELWLWGMWRIRWDKGGFHLWPEGEPDPTQKRLHAELDLPFGDKVKDRVPADILPF